jgi:hypothetical protein|nr:MAG TPA: hypothetical protein [Caudoviricetes sp.]
MDHKKLFVAVIITTVLLEATLAMIVSPLIHLLKDGDTNA